VQSLHNLTNINNEILPELSQMHVLYGYQQCNSIIIYAIQYFVCGYYITTLSARQIRSRITSGFRQLEQAIGVNKGQFMHSLILIVNMCSYFRKMHDPKRLISHVTNYSTQDRSAFGHNCNQNSNNYAIVQR